MNLTIIILAAGAGTRMKSALPKVLHTVGGRTLLEHVAATAATLEPRQVMVVYGHGGEHVPETLSHLPVTWVHQAERLGTGHAVSQALPEVPDSDVVLILYGDVPLVRRDTLASLVAAVNADTLALLTIALHDPTGYGRILRDGRGRVRRIVEQKDASDDEKAVREINTGVMAVAAGRLKPWLAALDNNNSQGEYYLTDIIAKAVADGVNIHTVSPRDELEILGVNDKVQLAQVERRHQADQAERLMRAGVTLRDPARFDLRGTLTAGADVVIDVGVVMEGEVVLGNGVYVGPYTILRNTTLGDGVQVLSHCVIDEARVGARCRIGPFARIRPGTGLDEEAHIGNFVEIKAAQVGKGSKINHLSYLGDASVGHGVNIGAGTITCNYDGANKHRTVIGDDVFIGSDTQLIAPVTVGDGATIGAGSTITRDAPAGKLTLSRVRQETRPGWRRPTKTGKGDKT
jgi:bifunctional UDP-N-acetylglucosamine pyrophosphorylase/glucosamine-1-phosphate N-acetyltransferase